VIISRTPLRISLAGGGSDLPKFYEHRIGSVLTFSINKYVYISISKSFEDKIRLAYSRIEEAFDYDELRHPLVRNTFKLLGIGDKLEIHSIADVPGNGSGLGSSSAFTVGLISSLMKHARVSISNDEIARLACKVEIEMCNSRIGKQDQYATAIGGLNQFNFSPSGDVGVEKISIDKATRDFLETTFQVFYIGHGRSSSKMLRQSGTSLSDSQYLELTQELVELVAVTRIGVLNRDIDTIARVINRSWHIKKAVNPLATNTTIERMFAEAFALGALGGKVLGAGGGGFLLLIAPSRNYINIRRYMGAKYKQLEFKIDDKGCSNIFIDKDKLDDF